MSCAWLLRERTISRSCLDSQEMSWLPGSCSLLGGAERCPAGAPGCAPAQLIGGRTCLYLDELECRPGTATGCAGRPRRGCALSGRARVLCSRELKSYNVEIGMYHRQPRMGTCLSLCPTLNCVPFPPFLRWHAYKKPVASWASMFILHPCWFIVALHIYLRPRAPKPLAHQ